MMKLLGAFLTYFIFWCQIQGQNVKVDQNKLVESFSDIDMFTLNGVKAIRPGSSYPYIRINYTNAKERNITYCINKDLNISRCYKKIDNYWYANYVEVGDTSRENVYQYLQPDKIITLKYLITNHNRNGYLREVAVFEKWKEKIYLIKDDLVIRPDLHVPEMIISKAETFYERKIKVSNGVLSLHEKVYDKSKKPMSDQKTCYKIGTQSYFGWLYLNIDKKPVPCN